MFDQINKRSFYRKNHLEAPLLEERLIYLESLNNRGNSLTTIKTAACFLLRIIEFLGLKAKKIVTNKEIEEAANSWEQYQRNHPQKHRLFSYNSKEHFIRYATDWLKMICYLEAPPEDVALLYKIFERKHAITRHLSAPLLKERIAYLQYWAENGAVLSTLRFTAQYLLLIIDYLKLDSKNRGMISIAEIEKAALKWAATSKNKPRLKKPGFSEYAEHRFIYHAISWLKMMNCLKNPEVEKLPFANELCSYINYMRDEQGLSENTIYARNSILKNFLMLAWEKTKTLNNLNVLVIDEIIAYKQNTDKYSRRSIQNYATVIRSFIKYAEQSSLCSIGLAKSIRIARTYKHESLPYSPLWDDVKKILAKTEGDNPTNIRDRAILMMLTVYGLRRSEVVNLKLNDIDWKQELLKINRAKKAKPQVFPLSKTVGDSILRYIREIRPNNCCHRSIVSSN